jgi:hypothetical protein
MPQQGMKRLNIAENDSFVNPSHRILKECEEAFYVHRLLTYIHNFFIHF